MLVVILLVIEILPLPTDPAHVTPLHAVAVVETMTLLLANAATMVEAKFESIDMSFGSMSQIPPRPALIEASMLST